MAKLVRQNDSNGDMRMPNPKKNTKKQSKSNITNKMKARHAQTGATADEGDSDGGEGDPSAIADPAEAIEQPDAFALSGAWRPGAGRAARRLAGYHINDENMFTEASQVIGGAELDDLVSDDDDYAGVENVSDGEDSEADVDESSILMSAEQDLIDEFERTEQRRNTNHVMSSMNGMAINEEQALDRDLDLEGLQDLTWDHLLEVDMDEDPFFGLPKDDTLYNDMWKEAESELWRMPEDVQTHKNSDTPNATQKRVRFEDLQSRSSSISSSEDPNEAFPDLFAAADDPLVTQHLELFMQQDASLLRNGVDDSESFYDFEDEDEKFAFLVDEESDSDDEISSSDCMLNSLVV